ncbi:MAG: lipopolysaccharide heptosyltransferase II [Nitrospirae bacterium]|nr:MAG: lipopolysaccharide heptosyltransferase II [Nitrospirota bacterium]
MIDNVKKNFNASNKSVNKILIRSVNWIGDAVMTLPAIRAIREGHRGDFISLLGKEWVLPLFEKDPNIDALITYSSSFKGIKGKFFGARVLKKESFRRAILLQNAIDAAILSFLAGIPERMGYARDGRGFLLTSGVRINSELLKYHHILYYLELLRELGYGSTFRIPWIYLDHEEREEGLRRITELRRPVILLNPGAAYGSAKRWPIENFTRLSEMVINDLGGSIVITGSKSEMEIGKSITSKIPGELKAENTILDLSGRTTLRELITVISAVDLVVTNDSGPMHITYAVGTPLVALFGSTDPALTGPPDLIDQGSLKLPVELETGAPSIVLKKDIPCSPCFKRECPEKNTECLRKISPDEVLQAIKELLPSKRAVFFDRDGTLCRDAHYLNNWDDFEPFDGLDALKRLKDAGFLLIGVTNQSGIKRGLVDREFTESVNRFFIDRYGFDDFLYCPHLPEDNCACRKPSPGMLFTARKKYGIDLKRSYMVGDKESDITLGESVGATTIRISGDGEKTKRNEIQNIVQEILDRDNKTI